MVLNVIHKSLCENRLILAGFVRAGTARERQKQLDWARPDLSKTAQLEGKIRTVQLIGHDGTPAGMRRYVAWR
jgi:hypothetical protein